MPQFFSLISGDFTYEKRAAQETLSAALKEAFFNELRSKQKTGYIAKSAPVEVEERLFQLFLVQSNSHGTEDLSSALNNLSKPLMILLQNKSRKSALKRSS